MDDDGPPMPGAPEATDAALMARVAARDVAAFTALYDRHAHVAYALAAHLLGRAEAEEIVQAVFLRVWHKAGQFDPARGPFGAWFLAITRHQALDELRKRGQRRRLIVAEEIDGLLGLVPDHAADVAEQVWVRARGAAALAALETLPAEQRRVLVLAYFGGLSQATIARELGLPLGTVKKRLRLGLGKLRACLMQQGLGDEFPVGPARAGRE